MDVNKLDQSERAVSEPGAEMSAEERRTAWSGPTVISALRNAIAHFEPHVPTINALNVFPVPDGDTGTNMHLTMKAAVREVEKLNHGAPARAGDVMASAAHGALMGARGNSGVILYQIIAGLAEMAADVEALDGPTLAAGLRRASDLAYQAVAKPVEGTMLTVIREAATAAEIAAARDPSVESVLQAALSTAEDSLRRTPELLDVLRQAGVVDAGGQGLVVLLDSLQRFTRGDESRSSDLSAAAPAGMAAAALHDLAKHISDDEAWGYCINFVVSGDAIPIDEFRARLDELGQSAVIVGDSRLLKIHMHSERPGLVLEAAQEYGELHEIRIDNMDAQTREIRAARAAYATPTPAAAGAERAAESHALTDIAIVAVASGDGIAAALRGLGAHDIVPGGLTLNPSIEDILNVVKQVRQDKVILLPNDSNVIVTSQHVDRLTPKQVRLVPSRSIPQGLSALSAFHFERDLEENVEAMTKALSLVKSLALTRATRDVEIDGVAARAGQFIGLIDNRMRAAGDDPVEVVVELLDQSAADEAELLTVFVGEPVDDDLAERLVTRLEADYPGLAVEVTAGGQPHYHLIMALE